MLEDNAIDDPAKTTRDEASLEEELPSHALHGGSGLEPAAEEQSAVLESVDDLDEGNGAHMTHTARTHHSCRHHAGSGR